MHFKSLELIGFKSFADKTRLEFGPGMTAIVGPNGCGKSNIADAIRWVLGEQSARLLRGLKMQDVIFNGADQRKPLGFAEVSLTLAGADKLPGVDYNEVMVTRRVYRSGEGEYLVNKNLCRLKDINELFAGTGIGLSAYSILEQGKIDMVLSSKPEDRRFVFEEAAGITKYKEKKKEALRKLESTEENLIRLKDIIEEVKRQLASVERQAARAKRAKEVGDELKHLEVQLSARSLADLDEQIRTAEKGYAEAGQREFAAQKLIEELENEQESLRVQLYTLDRELGSAQEKRVGVADSIGNKRNRIEANERLIGELTENEELYTKELENLKGSLKGLQEEKEALEQSAGGAQRRCSETEKEMENIGRKLEQVRGQLRDMETRISRQRAEAVEVINETARYKNELAGLKNNLRNDSLRATRLRVERRELLEKIEIAIQALREKQSHRQGIEERRGEQGRSLSQLRESLREVGEEEARLRDEHIQCEKTIAGCESQLELLKRHRDAYEGYIDGVKTIFNEAGREGTKLEGILGVVADKFEVPEKYARALEVALGHSLQLLMVRSAQDALAAFPIIEDRGEASFLPLDGLDEPESLEQPQGVGLLGSALDFVTCERTFSPAARQLLANTYFVRDLSSALRIFEISRPGVRLATLSGELLVSRGTMRKIGREASPLLSREREISRLERRYKELKAEKDEMQRAVDEARERYNITDRRFSDEQELAQRLEIELAGARGEEARTEHHCQNLKAESDSVGKEISEIENQQGESALEERDLQRRISEGQEREEAVDNSLRELQEALALKTDEREQIQAFITELKVKLATAREEEKSARLRFERASSEVKKVQDAVEARNVQIQRSASRRRALAAEIEGLRVAIDSLLSEKDTTDTNIKDREESKSTLYEKLKNAESRLKEQISRVGELKDETSKHEIVLVKRRAERDVIAGRIRDQYEVDLTGVALDEGIEDWNSVKEKIEKLKNRLKRIGPVNMVALEEHKELENRFNFLTDQEKDLLSARDSLKKAIDRINTETTRMFTETFEAVKTHFREMFTELFGGGSANLVLEEGVDILEAGINIVARPPGKKLQNISLLSGGERALTAVSLLFAILKVKPSPFCVLDEIDAPLDESNINRFLALLQKFLENSQFIIVTHNKRTISMADIMYGITMEESGVSKVVSAKLTKEHEKKSGSRERSTAGSKATR